MAGKLALCREERMRIMDEEKGAPPSGRKPVVTKTKKAPTAGPKTRKGKLGAKRSKSGKIYKRLEITFDYKVNILFKTVISGDHYVSPLDMGILLLAPLSVCPSVCPSHFRVRFISFEPLVGFTNNFPEMLAMIRRCAVPLFDQGWFKVKNLTLFPMLHMGYSSPSVIALVYDFTFLYKKIWFHPGTYGGWHDCFRFR